MKTESAFLKIVNSEVHRNRYGWYSLVTFSGELKSEFLPLKVNQVRVGRDMKLNQTLLKNCAIELALKSRVSVSTRQIAWRSELKICVKAY